jgi:hypothetical protein
MDWSEIKPVAPRLGVADYPPNTIKPKKIYITLKISFLLHNIQWKYPYLKTRASIQFRITDSFENRMKNVITTMSKFKDC